MSNVRNFVTRLAMAKKGFQEIKELTAAAYRDQAIRRTQIYSIINKVKSRVVMPQTREANTVRRQEGTPLSSPTLPPRCRKMGVSPSGNLLRAMVFLMTLSTRSYTMI